MSDKRLLDVLQDKFQCLKCGECCRCGGQMRITPAEAQRIADYLDIDMGDMQLFPFTALSDDPDWLYLEVCDPCFFLDKATYECMIHEVKPRFCADYPWRLYGDHETTFNGVMVCQSARAQLNALLESRVVK